MGTSSQHLMCFKTFSKAPVEQLYYRRTKTILLALGELLIASKDIHFFLSDLPKSSYQWFMYYLCRANFSNFHFPSKYKSFEELMFSV